MNIPKHIAIILDGNGRWAKSKGMPRNYGHTMGAKNVETVCKAANELGIKYLTLYCFKNVLILLSFISIKLDKSKLLPKQISTYSIISL